jgi:hemoglobin-like flavoprotein
MVSRPAARHPGPGVVRLVQFNCQRLFPQEVLLVDHFQGMLRDLVPEVRRLSAPDGRHLSEQIVRSVLWSALTQDPQPTIETTLRELGSDQHRQGLPDDGYLGVGHALLRSARTLTDSGWSSELSSAWVAYYSWLSGQFEAGAGAVLEQADPGTDPATGRPGGVAPVSLDEVLMDLRARYFPDDARGLESICTRVTLRTGADLRAPRPDQDTDPGVLADVLATLMIMGYSLSDPPRAPSRPASTVLVATGSPHQPSTSTHRSSPGSQRRRWLHPFRRQGA